jgi:hypothetical protein
MHGAKVIPIQQSERDSMTATADPGTAFDIARIDCAKFAVPEKGRRHRFSARDAFVAVHREQKSFTAWNKGHCAHGQSAAGYDSDTAE